MTYTFTDLLLIISVMLFISITASKTTGKINIPSLLLFLGIGMFAGSDIVGIYLDDPHIAQSLGVISLILILFSGGLDTQLSVVKPVLLHGALLSTVGVLISTFSIGYFVSYISDFTLLEGLLLGAIVSSTDAAAVFSILRSKKSGLKGKIRPILELESGSNDPMAYFLTIAFTYLLANPTAPVLDLVPIFIKQMVIGSIFGFLMGNAMELIINKIKLDIEGLYPVLLLSLTLFTYAGCDFIGGNGFLAVYISGIILGNKNFAHKKSLLRFYDGQAWLMQIVMFITLGLLVFPIRIIPIIGIGLIVSLFLIFIARPLAVFVSLSIAGRTNLKEKIFLSWVGLRGAVPIIFATYPMIAGIGKANMIFNIVFFIVITSIILQGTTLGIVARWLKLEVPQLKKRRFPLDLDLADEIKNELMEIIVPENSSSVGKSILQLKFPKHSLIALIERNKKYLQPKGSTIIEKGDKLYILSKDEHEFDLINTSIQG